jgi:hypothetical protein
MTDSDAHKTLEAKHDRNRQQRLEGIKRWVKYIETHDPSEWGDQQNRLVDSPILAGSATNPDYSKKNPHCCRPIAIIDGCYISDQYQDVLSRPTDYI